MPDLSYEPATARPPSLVTGVHVFDIAVAPGQGRAFSEAVRAMNKVRKDMGYRYPVFCYRVRMGEPRTVSVTFFDTSTAYFGKNSLGTLLEWKAALPDEWRKAPGALLAIPADAVARAIAFAAEQPDDVDVNEILLRPTAQEL